MSGFWKRPGRMRLEEVWLTVPTMLMLALVWSSPRITTDIWIHLNSGRWMVTHGSFITRDWLTFTIFDEPVLNQPWLAQLALYGLMAAGKLPLVQFVIGLLYGGAVALVTRLVHRIGGSGRMAAFLGVCSVLLMHNNLGMRPQAFATLLFALELTILHRYLSRRWCVPAVGAIAVLWANLHGSFPLVVALPGIFLAGELGNRFLNRDRPPSQPRRNARPLDSNLRHALLATLVASTAIFCNPNTSDVVLYVLGVTSTATSYPVTEWVPTWQTLSGVYLFASAAACLTVVVLSKRLPAPPDLLLLLLFFALALSSQRMLLWWGLSAPVAITSSTIAAARRFGVGMPTKDAPRFLNTALFGLFLVFLVGFVPWFRDVNPLIRSEKRTEPLRAHCPDNAIAHLRDSTFEGRLFLPMEDAGRASWELGPNVKMFADARLDFFPNRVWDDYFDILEGRDDALVLLERFRVNRVIVSRRNALLEQRLEGSEDWTRGYSDPGWMIFQRRTP